MKYKVAYKIFIDDAKRLGHCLQIWKMALTYLHAYTYRYYAILCEGRSIIFGIHEEQMCMIISKLF